MTYLKNVDFFPCSVIYFIIAKKRMNMICCGKNLSQLKYAYICMYISNKINNIVKTNDTRCV